MWLARLFCIKLVQGVVTYIPTVLAPVTGKLKTRSSGQAKKLVGRSVPLNQRQGCLLT